MAGSLNKVMIIGNLGSDPEVRYLESGQAVANFNIATNRTYKTKEGEKREEVEWHRIVLWGRTAEIAEKYVKKGQTVYIEGRLRTRQWKDQNGNDRYTTEIVGDTMTMLSSQRDDNQSYQANTPAQTSETAIPNPAPTTNDDIVDDLPF